jgi:small subunit ribosomal protein S6
MARSKSSEVPHYEVLYIISNKYSEKELSPINDKVKKTITDHKGNITFTEEWGKKKLAYPIKHFNYGYYFLIEFDLEGSKLSAVDRVLRLDREILRHQIVKIKKKTKEEIAKEEEIAKKITKKKQEELNKKEDVKKEKKDNKNKVELKDLDKKLDKILDTKDLL